MLARAQDCFTNLWPYLRKRRLERSQMQERYAACFLSRYIPNPMSELLWTNPDRGNEVEMALKYVGSCLFCITSS